MRARRRTDDGFSIVEVLIAVVVLGVTGTALLNGLQSNVLQARSDQDRTRTTVTLSAAATAIKRATFVSCAEDNTPYADLVDGVTVSVEEFVSYETQPWQACSDVRATGSAQRITIRNANGAERTMLRFADTATTSSPPPSPPSEFSASAALNPGGSCSGFRSSKPNKPCVVTVSTLSGSGGSWQLTALEFAGGAISNQTPTPVVDQSQPISVSTYLTNGTKSCPSGSTIPLRITALDVKSGQSTVAEAVLTC